MSLLSRLFGKAEKPRSVTLAHTRGFTHEIVGEASYQANLAKIAGSKTEQSANHECLAILECDDNNPHDANAIAVKIDNRLVGYLPRNEAKTYRDKLRTIDAKMLNAEVRAKIVGGWKNDEDEGHFGVKLNLKRPLQFAKN
jgi:hypothetical protein